MPPSRWQEAQCVNTIREISRSQVMVVVMTSCPDADTERLNRARIPARTTGYSISPLLAPLLPKPLAIHWADGLILEREVGPGQATAFPEIFLPGVLLLHSHIGPLRRPSRVIKPRPAGESLRDSAVQIFQDGLFGRAAGLGILPSLAARPSRIGEDNGRRSPAVHAGI